MNLLSQLFPQIMGHAARPGLGAALAAAGLAAGGGDGLVHRQNNVGDAQLAAGPRQAIAAARSAHAGDQAAPAQLGEKLFDGARRRLAELRLKGLLVWALADNDAACSFYLRLGGKPVAEGAESFGEVSLRKVAFAWS